MNIQPSNDFFRNQIITIGTRYSIGNRLIGLDYPVFWVHLMGNDYSLSLN